MGELPVTGSEWSWTNDGTDYLKHYDADSYLLGVGERFRETGALSAQDLYLLFIWKANRAKNRHRDRLKKRAGSFHDAVGR